MRTLWDNKWAKMRAENRSHANMDMVTRAILKFILKFINNSHKKIIETGCGTGRICFFLAQQLPNSEIIGTDISEDSIALCEKGKIAKKTNNCSFLKADINKLPFQDGTFDISLCEGVLQHIPNDMSGLKEMVRITKKDGLIFASVINIGCVPHTIYKFIKGKRYEHYPEKAYSHKSLTKLFKEAGLSEIEIYGVYPGYAMQRIEGYLPILGSMITQLLYLTAFVVDKYSKNWFSNQFGIQLVAKGVKR